MTVRRKQRHQTVVLTGIAGRFGRMLARALHQDFQVIGIDPRGAHHIPKDVTVHALDIRRKQAEDIFRRNRIDAVIHFNPTAEWKGRETEHRSITVLGTQKILEYCQKHGVPKVVLLSTSQAYGARPDNNQFLTEEAPLLAGHNFEAMRDLVEIDMYAQSYFWRHPEVDTVILRPAPVIGRLGNLPSAYFALLRTPTLLGFDPMVQVMSPEDLIHAIRLALKPGIRGVFNIAGPGPLPLAQLIRRLGHRPVPLPEPLARAALGLLFDVKASSVPVAMLDYLKYVCMVDDARARETLRYAPRLTLDQTLSSLRN